MFLVVVTDPLETSLVPRQGLLSRSVRRAARGHRELGWPLAARRLGVISARSMAAVPARVLTLHWYRWSHAALACSLRTLGRHRAQAGAGQAPAGSRAWQSGRCPEHPLPRAASPHSGEETDRKQANWVMTGEVNGKARADRGVPGCGAWCEPFPGERPLPPPAPRAPQPRAVRRQPARTPQRGRLTGAGSNGSWGRQIPRH